MPFGFGPALGGGDGSRKGGGRLGGYNMSDCDVRVGNMRLTLPNIAAGPLGGIAAGPRGGKDPMPGPGPAPYPGPGPRLGPIGGGRYPDGPAGACPYIGIGGNVGIGTGVVVVIGAGVGIGIGCPPALTKPDPLVGPPRGGTPALRGVKPAPAPAP